MNIEKIVILGAGGFARELLDVFDAFNKDKPSFDVMGYVVDLHHGTPPGAIINDKPIIGDFKWLERHKNEVMVICGVGAPDLRMDMIKRAKNIGVRFCSIIHPNALLTKWVTIGEGSVITAGCILTNQIRIGNHVHLNLDSTIGHDVVIEDFVTVSPGSHISGNVKLGEGCFIGTGANIIESKNVGAWSVVGAGSVIVKDVPQNTTVVGVPGKIIKTNHDGWHLK